MTINLFLNSERQLRNGWWILIFFLVLAALLVPTLLLAQQNSVEVSMGLQAVLIILASLVCQLLRKKPLVELTGKFDGHWFREFCLGGFIGSLLMLAPALLMWTLGWVDWQANPAGFSTLAANILLFAGVAAAEEGLFRGFVFQRLAAGLSHWPAQLIVAAFFLLTHLNNPGMIGATKVLASVNIFVASLIFGLAFIRTRSLAMPLGLHFMANLMQGGVLGFGVSGTEQSGMLTPVFSGVPDWLTGGLFGIEASLLGLIGVLATLILLHKWDGAKRLSLSNKQVPHE